MKTLNIKFPKMNSRVAYQQPFRALRNEAGAILVMAMLLMIVIVLLATATTQMTAGDFARVSNYEESRKAFYIAEAGIEKAKFYMKTQTYNEFLLGPDQLSGTTATDADNGLIHDGSTLKGKVVSIDGETYSQFDYDGGTYSVRVYDNEDETPNDPYTDSDNVIIIESIGDIGNPIQKKIVTASMFDIISVGATVVANIFGVSSAEAAVNPSQSRIVVAYRKYKLPTLFPSAVIMVGPIYRFRAGGNIHVDGGNRNNNGFGWDIKGYGVKGDGASTKPSPDSSCVAKNAITVESAAVLSNETWNGGSKDGFLGITNWDNGDSIADIGYNQTDFTYVDAINFRKELMGYCEYCYAGHHDSSDNYVEKFSSSAVLGTLDNPVITYVDGNARMAGGARGAGVLIIDGNLDIQGDFHWAGVILIGGCETCWGELKGVGTARIYGAMVVGNALDADGEFSGSADIYYSCEGVEKAVEVINNTFREVGWQESN